ncbi:hypothetical protein PMAYCL1PPCAC_08494, partial [Pristionchus mayeri]
QIIYDACEHLFYSPEAARLIVDLHDGELTVQRKNQANGPSSLEHRRRQNGQRDKEATQQRILANICFFASGFFLESS